MLSVFNAKVNWKASAGILTPLIVAGFSIVSLAYAESPCKTTLAYLSAKIPHSHDSQLQQFRTEILNTKVQDAIDRVRAHGLSLSSTTAQVLKDLPQYEEAKRDAEECIEQISYPQDRIMAHLKSGDLQNAQCGRDDSALDSCICEYILNDWMILMTKELAIQVACMTK